MTYSSMPNHLLLSKQLQFTPPPPCQWYWSIQFPCVQTTLVWWCPVTKDDHFSPHTLLVCHTVARTVPTFHFTKASPTHVLFCFLTTALKSTSAQPGTFMIPQQPWSTADLQKPSCLKMNPVGLLCDPLSSPRNTIYDYLTQEVISRDAHDKIPVNEWKVLSLTSWPREKPPWWCLYSF